MSQLLLLAYIAIAGFCASVLLHLAAILAPSLIQYIEVVTLITAFIAFLLGIPMVFMEVFADGPPTIRSQPGKKFARSLPKWSTSVAAVLYCYVMISSVLIGNTIGNAYPAEYDGRYFLERNGTSIQINQEEYESYRAYRARAFTSFLMLYCFVTVCYFAIYKRGSTRGKTADLDAV